MSTTILRKLFNTIKDKFKKGIFYLIKCLRSYIINKNILKS